MKKLLLSIWFCLVPVICIAGCSKPDKPAAEKIAVINKDSIFVNKYLPEIRDAFCAETLTVQYLKHIWKGKILTGRYPNGVNWVKLCTDTTDSCLSASVFLNTDSSISMIEINFPFNLWHAEQMIPIFGQYTDSRLPKMKDAAIIDFQFGKDCQPQKSVTGWLNGCGSIIGSVHMTNTLFEDSSGTTVDSRGVKIKL